MNAASEPGSRPLGRARTREAWVWAAGLGAALALFWAAWVVGQAPDELAQAEVTSTARVVARGVEQEWEALRRSEAFRGLSNGQAEALIENLPESPPGAAELAVQQRALDPDPGAEPRAFVTLLEEARALERRGDAAGAQAALAQTLEADPSADDLAQVRLLELKLAVRVGLREEIFAAWDRVQTEVPWEASRSGRPLRLLAAWSAAPDLDDPRRERFLDELATLGSPYVLAGPQSQGRAVADKGQLLWEPSPFLAATLALCRSAWPETDEVLRSSAAWRQQLADQVLKGLAAPAGAAPDWTLGETSLGLAARRPGSSGFLVDRAALPARLVQNLSTPPDFHLAFGPDSKAPGKDILSSLRLAAGGPEFSLRHIDPARLAQLGLRRRRLTRWSLLALALGCLAGATITVRSLRRERRVAELRSAFVAGVSHDLRTPLASILLLAENLETGRVGEDRVRQYTAAIAKEAERLRRRVDDVLDFARMERGERARAQRESVHCADLVAELLAELQAQAQAAGFRLDSEVRDLPDHAELDPDALRRVLGNLVENALRHSGGQLVQLRISGGPDSLDLIVQDDGRGIPAGKRERVLRPFERLEAAVDPKGGTGLGLAIVMELVSAQGGSLQLDSAPDTGGARFTIRLPLGEEAA